MPRIARIYAPNVVQHTIVRFVDDHWVLTSSFLRYQYLCRLGETLRITDWRLLAYALMSNHIHLVFLSGYDPLKKWALPTHTGFANWLNANERRQGMRVRGPVFAERPTTVLIPPDRVGLVIAYVHNNPQRAYLVDDPSQSKWTSHRCYIGVDRPLPFLDIAVGLELSDFDNTPAGRAAFHEYVSAHRKDPKDPTISANMLARAFSNEERKGLLARKPIFGQEAKPEIPSKASCAISARDFIAAASSTLSISCAELCSTRRDKSVSDARSIIVLAWRELGGPLSQIASALSITRSAATHIIKRKREQLGEEAQIAVSKLRQQF